MFGGVKEVGDFHPSRQAPDVRSFQIGRGRLFPWLTAPALGSLAARRGRRSGAPRRREHRSRLLTVLRSAPRHADRGPRAILGAIHLGIRPRLRSHARPPSYHLFLVFLHCPSAHATSAIPDPKSANETALSFHNDRLECSSDWLDAISTKVAPPPRQAFCQEKLFAASSQRWAVRCHSPGTRQWDGEMHALRVPLTA